MRCSMTLEMKLNLFPSNFGDSVILQIQISCLHFRLSFKGKAHIVVAVKSSLNVYIDTHFLLGTKQKSPSFSDVSSNDSEIQSHSEIFLVSSRHAIRSINNSTDSQPVLRGSAFAISLATGIILSISISCTFNQLISFATGQYNTHTDELRRHPPP